MSVFSLHCSQFDRMHACNLFENRLLLSLRPLRLIEVGLTVCNPKIVRILFTNENQQTGKKITSSKPTKKKLAQIHALIKRTYIFQKVGISVLNRINSDILQYIFIVCVSFLWMLKRENESERISSMFPFRGCETQFYLFLLVVMCVAWLFILLLSPSSFFDVWILLFIWQ